jgi:pyrimidine-specific ribonucleoside hydrolase
MGLRAREFFNIGIDDIKVITYAGRKPPLSCMNDGLQVSTGGTLGHGLIFLADDDKNIPMAVLSYKDRTVIIKLKNEYINIVRNDIKNCISEYGNLTEEYWSCVRRLALEYWVKWDRNIMFNLKY